MMRAVLVLSLVLLCLTSGSARAQNVVKWEAWSEALFDRAKQEKRLLILDLEAVWCHWCHVMEETTYRDSKVVALLAKRYIAIRVDQEARPDISNRYGEFGWPATILFDENGRELAKLAGYQPPEKMRAILQAFSDDPTPGPSAAATAPPQLAEQSSLSPDQRSTLKETLFSHYDNKLGAFKFSHKYLDRGFADWAMDVRNKSVADASKKAKQTLEAQKALLDPAFGGVYQYSAGGTWKEPHFEKLISTQADNLSVYARAYGQWHDAKYLTVAKQIDGFLNGFLRSPEGMYYTSQDADLVPGKHSADYFALSNEQRRKQGIPKVDQHVYARENGWVIQALVDLYSATGEDAVLQRATQAAQAIKSSRGTSEGGFRHDEKDLSGPYLGDSLAMGRAFLALYGATGDRSWLKDAEKTAQFIQGQFAGDKKNGFLTAKALPTSRFQPQAQADENLAFARFGNLLNQYTGNADYRKMAEQAFRFASAPAMGKDPFLASGILTADFDLSAAPPHITVVGKKSDAAARELFKGALSALSASTYKRIEWLDREEGPLPNSSVQFPPLKEAAAFVCAEGRCSLPAKTPQQIKERLERFAAS